MDAGADGDPLANLGDREFVEQIPATRDKDDEHLRRRIAAAFEGGCGPDAVCYG